MWEKYEVLELDRTPVQVLDDLYKSLENAVPWEGFSEEAIQYMDELCKNHPKEYLWLYGDIISSVRKEKKWYWEVLSRSLKNELWLLDFDRQFEECFWFEFWKKKFNTTSILEYKRSHGLDISDRNSMAVYLIARNLAKSPSDNWTRKNQLHQIRNPILIRKILLKRRKPKYVFDLQPSSPGDKENKLLQWDPVLPLIPSRPQFPTWERNIESSDTIVVKLTPQALPKSIVSFIPSVERWVQVEWEVSSEQVTQEQLQAVREKHSNDVEAQIQTKQEERLLQDQVKSSNIKEKQKPEEKFESFDVNESWFGKLIWPSMSHGVDDYENDSGIVSYYEVVSSFKTTPIELLTTTDTNSWSWEDRWLEGDALQVVWKLHCDVKDGALLPTLLNGNWLHAVPTGTILYLDSKDGQTIESSIDYDTTTHRYRLNTNYTWRIEFELGVWHEHTTDGYSLAQWVKDFSWLRISKEWENMLTYADWIKNDPLEMLWVVRNYMHDKFQYTTLKKFFDGDWKVRDSDSDYMYGDCDVLAEQVVFYLEQLWIKSEIQHCYMDTNGDGTIMKWEYHGIVKIHLPDGTVRREDITTWVETAEFQPPEATAVPFHGSQITVPLPNLQSGNENVSSALNAMDLEYLEVFFEEVSGAWLATMHSHLKSIESLPELDDMYAIMYLWIRLIQSIEDWTYRFDDRILKYIFDNNVQIKNYNWLLEVFNKTISSEWYGYRYIWDSKLYRWNNESHKVNNDRYAGRNCFVYQEWEVQFTYSLHNTWEILDNWSILENDYWKLTLDWKILSRDFIWALWIQYIYDKNWNTNWFYFIEQNVDDVIVIKSYSNDWNILESVETNSSIEFWKSTWILWRYPLRLLQYPSEYDGNYYFRFLVIDTDEEWWIVHHSEETDKQSLSKENTNPFKYFTELTVIKEWEELFAKSKVDEVLPHNTSILLDDIYTDEIWSLHSKQYTSSPLTLSQLYSLLDLERYDNVLFSSRETTKKDLHELFPNDDWSVRTDQDLMFFFKASPIYKSEFWKYDSLEDIVQILNQWRVETNEKRRLQALKRTTYDNRLEESYTEYMIQGARLEKQAIDLRNIYREEIWNLQRQQIVDALRKKLEESSTFNEYLWNEWTPFALEWSITNQNEYWEKIKTDKVSIPAPWTVLWKQKILEWFLKDKNLIKWDSFTNWVELIVADTYAVNPEHWEKFQPWECLEYFINQYPHLMPPEYYDKYPEQLIKKLDWIAILDYDHMISIMLKRPLYWVSKQYGRMWMAWILWEEVAEKDLLEEQEKHIQSQLEQTPWFDQYEAQHDQLWSEYLTERERLQDWNSDLYTRYLTTPEDKKLELYHELINYQPEFVKEYLMPQVYTEENERVNSYTDAEQQQFNEWFWRIQSIYDMIDASDDDEKIYIHQLITKLSKKIYENNSIRGSKVSSIIEEILKYKDKKYIDLVRLLFFELYSEKITKNQRDEISSYLLMRSGGFADSAYTVWTTTSNTWIWVNKWLRYWNTHRMLRSFSDIKKTALLDGAMKKCMLTWRTKPMNYQEYWKSIWNEYVYPATPKSHDWVDIRLD